ncbi:Sporulation initiation inhibitor protein Soj [Saezia sanguinis]|uniref:Sporulation initiation inhibitor protein Soj n=1 Tax=Saezia sanguinis TaxID=1965230 RepID=A0A433SFC4_9BURK|nr:ParA family protein [Saezia sanguinis]RUS67447.1 Sporulation initiation inhibitor protein Soj [Saezia sanguinis]
MLVISIISTKGGEGKTTLTANVGGFLANAGLRVLLIDLDIQPTLSSYYKLDKTAPCGIYELLAFNERAPDRIISNTAIPNLSLIFSNDDLGQLNTLLLHAPDGRFRLRNLLPSFKNLFDVVLIDTQGARSVLLEMAIIASSTVLSPVTPAILAAREFRRGTLQLMSDIAPYKHLGILPPPVNMLINRIPAVSANARLIQKTLKEIFIDQPGIRILNTDIPQIEAYPRAAVQGLPVHRVEYRQPSGRVAPAAIETMRQLTIELFPQWKTQLMNVTGRKGNEPK